ncbi:MAG TPA: winged helix-turn-helix domain-containing protein [Trebonia sp.]
MGSSLVRENGRVICAKSGDLPPDPFTNTVTGAVGRLRRKLGGSPVILTMPGIGYRIG